MSPRVIRPTTKIASCVVCWITLWLKPWKLKICGFNVKTSGYFGKGGVQLTMLGFNTRCTFSYVWLIWNETWHGIVREYTCWDKLLKMQHLQDHCFLMVRHLPPPPRPPSSSCDLFMFSSSALAWKLNRSLTFVGSGCGAAILINVTQFETTQVYLALGGFFYIWTSPQWLVSV